MSFPFHKVTYPAMVLVYGPSGGSHTEQLAMKVCQTPQEAEALLSGYPGLDKGVQVYAFPVPPQVQKLTFSGKVVDKFDAARDQVRRDKQLVIAVRSTGEEAGPMGW